MPQRLVPPPPTKFAPTARQVIAQMKVGPKSAIAPPPTRFEVAARSAQPKRFSVIQGAGAPGGKAGDTYTSLGAHYTAEEIAKAKQTEGSSKGHRLGNKNSAVSEATERGNKKLTIKLQENRAKGKAAARLERQPEKKLERKDQVREADHFKKSLKSGGADAAPKPQNKFGVAQRDMVNTALHQGMGGKAAFMQRLNAMVAKGELKEAARDRFIVEYDSHVPRRAAVETEAPKQDVTEGD